jgi:hypothetical protein
VRRFFFFMAHAQAAKKISKGAPPRLSTPGDPLPSIGLTFFHVPSLIFRSPASSQGQQNSNPQQSCLRKCPMAASLPNPSPELPQDSNDPAPSDTQEEPLTREELNALIDFFTLLDTWDKKKKIA